MTPADPAAAVSRSVVVNGVRLAFDDVGRGPAVLFVHGFLLDRTLWHNQLAALDGWRRIAPDLRGLGRSEAPERGYGMDVYADDLAKLLDALGLERAVLIGLSMGGYIAFQFLRRHRDRVAALVVLDARAEADTAERRADRDAMINRIRTRETEALVDELGSDFLAEQASRSAADRLAAMINRARVPGIVGALEAMRDRPDSRPLVRSVTNVAKLFVIGQHDSRTPRASMRAIANQAPDSRFMIIPGAGHLPPIERPAETTAVLRRFLVEVAISPR